jgi:hypothetical protein
MQVRPAGRGENRLSDHLGGGLHLASKRYDRVVKWVVGIQVPGLFLVALTLQRAQSIQRR